LVYLSVIVHLQRFGIMGTMTKRLAFLLISCVVVGTFLTGCHSRNDEDSAAFDDVGEQHVYDEMPRHEKNKVTLKATKPAVAEDRGRRHEMIGEMSIDE
jgi:hypothetical protein